MGTSSTTPETLAAIVEAGKRATKRPWGVVARDSANQNPAVGALECGNAEVATVWQRDERLMVDGHRPRNAAYIALATNHADYLAAELMRLRAGRDRVREILGRHLDWEFDWPLGPYEIALTCDEARELAAILTPRG